MDNRLPDPPLNAEFHETAKASQAAGIADESAGYLNAAADVHSPDGQNSDRAAGDAEPGPAPDNVPDLSDSIEPSHMPGSAEDIQVAGETGPGPSG